MLIYNRQEEEWYKLGQYATSILFFHSDGRPDLLSAAYGQQPRRPYFSQNKCKASKRSSSFFPKLFCRGRIHLSDKCAIKKLFCFSLEFNENWWNCSYLYVLKLHQVSLNSNEKQKSFLMTHLTDSPSVKGRWIRP